MLYTFKTSLDIDDVWFVYPWTFQVNMHWTTIIAKAEELGGTMLSDGTQICFPSEEALLDCNKFFADLLLETR